MDGGEALLRANQYRFSPNQALRKDDQTPHLWGTREALVLKAMAMVIGPKLPITVGPCGARVSVSRVVSCQQTALKTRSNTKLYGLCCEN